MSASASECTRAGAGRGDPRILRLDRSAGRLSIGTGGLITVHKVTAVVDFGTAVSPAGVRAHVMSAVVYGMSAALQGQITFKDG